MKYDFLRQESTANIVSSNYITEVEQKYGIRFPDALRDYYLVNNGREMAPAAMEIDGALYWVIGIFSFAVSALSIETILERQKLQEYPVKQMIPFAYDGGGGIYYCHMMTGIIYLSYLQGEDEFIEICPNITDFFNILNEAYQRDESNPFDISEIIRSDEKMADSGFLPLGSIVLLKGGTRKVMIIARGLNVKREDDTYFFDYGGVLYPEGLTGDQMVYFNQDGIVKVYFHGYSDDEDDVIISSLNDYLDNHPNINRADPATWNSET